MKFPSLRASFMMAIVTIKDTQLHFKHYVDLNILKFNISYLVLLCFS